MSNHDSIGFRKGKRQAGSLPAFWTLLGINLSGNAPRISLLTCRTVRTIASTTRRRNPFILLNKNLTNANIDFSSLHGSNREQAPKAEGKSGQGSLRRMEQDQLGPHDSFLKNGSGSWQTILFSMQRWSASSNGDGSISQRIIFGNMQRWSTASSWSGQIDELRCLINNNARCIFSNHIASQFVEMSRAHIKDGHATRAANKDELLRTVKHNHIRSRRKHGLERIIGKDLPGFEVNPYQMLHQRFIGIDFCAIGICERRFGIKLQRVRKIARFWQEDTILNRVGVRVDDHQLARAIGWQRATAIILIRGNLGRQIDPMVHLVIFDMTNFIAELGA